MYFFELGPKNPISFREFCWGSIGGPSSISSPCHSHKTWSKTSEAHGGHWQDMIIFDHFCEVILSSDRAQMTIEYFVMEGHPQIMTNCT